MEENVAVFIDGENISHNDLPYIMMEVRKFGRVIVNRIYGDWTGSGMEKWRQFLVSYSLEPIHCARLPKKNSVDIKMIDDIYDILYFKKTVGVYILVTNDMDYLTCGRKIKLFGKILITFGYNNCSEVLKNTSDKFVNISLLNIGDGEDSVEKDRLEVENVFGEIEMEKRDTGNSLVNKILQLMGGERHISLNNITDIVGVEDEVKKYPNYFRIADIKVANKTKKKIYDITSVNSDVHNTIYEQIKSIYEIADTNEILMPQLKERIVAMASNFDQRLWGFNRFKDMITVVFDGKLELIERGSSQFVRCIM